MPERVIQHQRANSIVREEVQWHEGSLCRDRIPPQVEGILPQRPTQWKPTPAGGTSLEIITTHLVEKRDEEAKKKEYHNLMLSMQNEGKHSIGEEDRAESTGRYRRDHPLNRETEPVESEDWEPDQPSWTELSALDLDKDPKQIMMIYNIMSYITPEMVRAMTAPSGNFLCSIEDNTHGIEFLEIRMKDYENN